MPTCTVCGEEQFDLVDGLFYCQLCQTQSQDLRQEEQEEFSMTRSYQLTIKAKLSEDRKKQIPDVDKGRAWTTHEAFELIIKEQVKSLISLGADPKLMDIVFKVWSLYLSKVGIAYTNDKDAANALNRNKPYIRDRFPGTYENPSITSVRKIYTINQNADTKPNKKELKRKREMEEYKLAFQTENLDEIENEELCSEEESSNVDKNLLKDAERDHAFLKHKIVKVISEKDGRYMETEERVKASAVYNSSRVEQMNLLRTVTFVMVGLMYTNPLTTCSDVARWIKTGKIPLKTAFEQLPDNMKFGPDDKAIFAVKNTALPSASKLRAETGRLIDFLKIRNFPAINVSKLASRFITQYRLPGELHGLVKKLVDQQHHSVTCTIGSSNYGLKNYSLIATAYIAFLIKLLFGLDDVTEKKLTEYANDLMKEVSSGLQLFIWDKWVSFMEQQTSIIQEQKFGLDIEEIRNVTNVSATVDMYQARTFRDTKTRMTEDSSSNKYIRKRPQFRENLKQPIRFLLEKLKARGPSSDAAPLAEQTQFSLPDTFSGASLDEPDNDVGHRNADEETFHNTSIRYLTDVNFLKDISRPGLSDYTVYSSCEIEESRASDWSSDEMLWSGDRSSDEMLSQDLFITQTTRKRRLSKAQQAVHNALKKKKVVRAIDHEYWERKLQHAYEHYAVYTSNTNAKRHRSFAWLLEVFSVSVDCDVEELNNTIKEIESVYSDEEHSVTKRTRVSKHGRCPLIYSLLPDDEEPVY